MDKNILKNITFRKLNKNDMDLFINLRIVFLEDRFSLKEDEKIKITNNLQIYFKEHICKNDFIGIIGEYDGNIISVAYMAIYDKPSNLNNLYGKIGTIMNVYTYPEYRKKGIAKKMVENIMDEAKNNGIKYFDLMASESGYKIYENIGFKESNDKFMFLKM
jgi:ribosomal protein S18 acetylase RimI-like enzyme